MRIPLEGRTIKRYILDTDFSDIAVFTITGEPIWDSATLELIVPVDVEPTSEQIQLIMERMITENDIEERLLARCKQALALNNEWRALVSPTNAQALQYLDTVALELNGLIHLVMRWLDSTD